MLLSACGDGAGKDAGLDWVEENQDGAVEVIATARYGATLALEHSLFQPLRARVSGTETRVRLKTNPCSDGCGLELR
jgi:hypothetical protein